MKKFIISLCVTLWILNILDGWSTYILIPAGCTEGNPYVNWVISLIGLLPALIVTKVPYLCLIIWFAYRYCKATNVTVIESRIITGGLILLVSVYTYILAFHNFVALYIGYDLNIL